MDFSIWRKCFTLCCCSNANKNVLWIEWKKSFSNKSDAWPSRDSLQWQMYSGAYLHAVFFVVELLVLRRETLGWQRMWFVYISDIVCYACIVSGWSVLMPRFRVFFLPILFIFFTQFFIFFFDDFRAAFMHVFSTSCTTLYLIIIN